MPPERAITYVTSRWGEPTQTFVRREAAAVQTNGVEIRALSLKRPVPVGSSTTASMINAYWHSPLQVASGLLKALVTQPRSTLSLLKTVVSRSSFRNLSKSVGAAVVGIAWAAHGTAGHAHLHSHFGWVSATATWAAARLAGLPYSIVLHAFEIHTLSLQDRFTEVPLQQASRVFTVSERDAYLVASRWGVTPSVTRMGVPRAWITHQPATPDPWSLVSVGSLLPKKGHDILLRALADADPRWNLTIAGEGPERKALEALTHDLGIADRVRMPGLMPEHDIRSMLDRSWVFALACRVTAEGDMDGIPVALMEAMARGVPVVTTAVGAIPELVAGAGVIVAPERPDELANALDSLISNGQRLLYSSAGRRRIDDQYTTERNAQQVTALANPFG